MNTGALTCIGIGSNLNQPQRQVDQAVVALGRLSKSRVTHVSSYYRTAAWGLEQQPDFINAVAAIQTQQTPLELLHSLQSIEQAQNRVREQKWGPRTLDLDILIYGDLTLQTPELEIPHRHCHERAFVLVPLAEIYPDLHIRGRVLGKWLSELDTSEVQRIG